MTLMIQEESVVRVPGKPTRRLSGERIMEFSGLTLIIFFAAWLRFSNLDFLGYVNHYYTAGVESMLRSWHNFFYVAAEPGGSVSIDKPPVGLWLQAISAYFLGVNGFSILLPQLLAGMISVILLYTLVRRSFGVIPGLLAALVMAITPIVVATDRNNTMDSTLILTLLLATWTFIKATETGKLRYLFLGAVLVGIGFNIKMLQAYLPLPAFYALYLLGSREKLWQKAGNLILTSILLFTVSFSWAVAVDLTPADKRPYVGSSSDNSEMNLILGYNGVNRLSGSFGHWAHNSRYGSVHSTKRYQSQPPNNHHPSNGPNRFSGAQPPFNGDPGNLHIGSRGPLRLFTPPLSKDSSWLLPLGIASLVLLAAGSRWQWPLTLSHQSLVLWGSWLTTCAVFFSVAGFIHEYYLSMLAPPLAALIGIGSHQLWRLVSMRPWLAIGTFITSALGTLAFQAYTATSFIQNMWWLPESILLLLMGLFILIISGIKQKQVSRFALGLALMAASIFITPGIWSILTNLSPSQNEILPSAYSGGPIGPVTQRSLQINQALLSYLESNTHDNTYLMAVPSALQGADYVLATGRPVLYLGGFSGKDHVVSANKLAQMVQLGKLRYLYLSQDNAGTSRKLGASSWITSSCRIVPEFDTSTRKNGTPDGATEHLFGTTLHSDKRATQDMRAFAAGDIRMTLYDCGSLQG